MEAKVIMCIQYGHSMMTSSVKNAWCGAKLPVEFQAKLLKYRKVQRNGLISQSEMGQDQIYTIGFDYINQFYEIRK